MDHPAGPIELAERGVYWARYTKLGMPIAYAVASNSDVVRRLIVKDRSRADEVLESLWNYLEAVDGKPMLRLRPILELPRTFRPAHLEVLDPYNLPLPGRWPRHG
jgi:hypothetical protein